MQNTTMQNYQKIIDAAPAKLAPDRIRKPKGQRKFVPTPEVLAAVEQLADTNLTKQMSAEAIGLSGPYFADLINKPGPMHDAWQRGKAIRAQRILEAAQRVEMGVIINATTPTKLFPGGIVAAQALFMDKIQGVDNGATEAGPTTETDEVIFRRVRPTAASAD